MKAFKELPDQRILTPRQISILMFALMTGVLLAALDRTVVAPAMPTIVGQVGGLDHYSWVITAYLLTFTAFMPLYGKVSDLYGRRPVMLFAVITFLLGSQLSGMSQHIWQLIAARAVQGLGAGGLMTMAFTIIGDHVSPRERPKYQGFFSATFALASLAGPLVGGYFADYNWRWIFYLNVPIGIVSMVALTTLLKVPHVRRESRVDYLGAVLMVSGVSLLLLVLSWGGKEYPWQSDTIIGLSVGGALLCVLFVLWQAFAAEPIVPLDLFRDRNFTGAITGGFVLGVIMFGAVFFIPMYFQVAKGYTATASGLLMLPVLLSFNVTAFLAGRAIFRLGRYKWIMVVGAVVMTAGLLATARLERATSIAEAATYMLLLGVGQGLIMQPLIVAVQNGLPPHRMGAGIVADTFFRSLGGTVGVAVLGAILNNRVGHWLPRLMPGAPGGPGGPGGPAGGYLEHDRLVGEPKAILTLSEPVRIAVQETFARSLHVVFLAAAAISAVAVVVTTLMPDAKLRGPDPRRGAGEQPSVGFRSRHVARHRPASFGESPGDPPSQVQAYGRGGVLARRAKGIQSVQRHRNF